MATLKRDQYQLFGDSYSILGGSIEIAGTLWIAQTFTPSVSANLNKVTVLLRKSNNPTDLTCAIYAVDGSNKPTGAALASQTIAKASISTDFQLLVFTFSSPASLTIGTMYAVVLKTAGGDDLYATYRWYGITRDNLANGKAWYSTNSGSTWSDGSTNYDFSIVTEMSTAVATPGLDQFSAGGLLGSGDDQVTVTTEYRLQTFTPSVTATMPSIVLGIARRGTQSGSTPGITVAVYAVDGSNNPTGSAISSIESINDTAIPTVANYLTVTFATAPSLTSGVTYAIVITFPGINGTSQGYYVRRVGSVSVYSGGEQKQSTNSGSTWATMTGSRDMLFGTFMLEPTTTTQTVNSDATIKITSTKTINSDAFCGQETVRAVNSNSEVVIVTERTVSSNAFCGEITSQTINSSAGIGATEIKAIQSDAFCGELTSQYATADAHIQITDNKQLLSDAHMLAAISKYLAANSTVIGIISQTISARANISIERSATVTSDATIMIQQPVLKFYVVT
jgi:hypothetical protein